MSTKKSAKPKKLSAKEKRIVETVNLINDVVTAAIYGKGKSKTVMMISRSGVSTSRNFCLDDAIRALFEHSTGEKAVDWLGAPQ